MSQKYLINRCMKKTSLPLQAISYLQQLANGNPRLVSDASNYFNALREQYENNKISYEEYDKKINEYILKNQ